MDDLERETESAAAEIGMSNREVAGRQLFRQRQPEATDPQRVARAAKAQRLIRNRYKQRHGDAEADILLKAGRTGKALGGVDHLRKTIPARADAGPDLAAARGIFGHRDDDRDAGLGTGRQRPADQASDLRYPPADRAEARVVDLADIDDRLAFAEAF
jgi:hypothetical protein